MAWARDERPDPYEMDEFDVRMYAAELQNENDFLHRELVRAGIFLSARKSGKKDLNDAAIDRIVELKAECDSLREQNDRLAECVVRIVKIIFKDKETAVDADTKS